MVYFDVSMPRTISITGKSVLIKSSNSPLKIAGSEDRARFQNCDLSCKLHERYPFDGYMLQRQEFDGPCIAYIIYVLWAHGLIHVCDSSVNCGQWGGVDVDQISCHVIG